MSRLGAIFAAARRSRAGGAASLILLALLLAPMGGADAAEKVVLQLSGEPQFEFAGYYAALWQGFYGAAGLDVTIAPGSEPGAKTGAIDPVREVASGRAQFGIAGTGLMIDAAKGAPVRLVAPIFQESGAAVYSRADGDLATPAALSAAKLGRAPAGSILALELATALEAEGIDPGEMAGVAIAPGGIVAALADHTVDAAIGSAWHVPWQAQQRKLGLNAFDPAQYRVAFYGDSLFTTRSLAASEPQLVERFRAASLEGWNYALSRPDAIAQRLVADLPIRVGRADPLGFAHYQAAVARRLARYPAVPLGHSNPARWRRIAASLLAAHAMPGKVDVAAFLGDSDASAAQPRGGSGAPMILLRVLLGLVVAALVASALVSMRRNRRATIAVADTPETPDRVALRIPAAFLETLLDLADEFDDVAEAIVQPLDDLHRQTLVQPRLARLCESAAAPLARLRLAARRLGAAALGETTDTGTDLNPMLGTLRAAIAARLPRNVAWRFSLEPALWLCRAALDPVATLVLELVAASGAAMPEGGSIVVGTRNYPIDAEAQGMLPGAEIGAYVRVTVRDNAPGLTPSALDHVFDRAASARPCVIAARALTRRHGGFARVESAPGLGTAVHLYFPRLGDTASTD